MKNTVQPKKTILITWATGLIGKRLVKDYAHKGWKVICLVRNKKKAKKEFIGLSITIVVDLMELPQTVIINAVVNLAGMPISIGLWTKARKEKILNSRLHTTRQVMELLKYLNKKPDIIIQGSACGYYGHGGNIELDEIAPPTEIFMSTLCQKWEKECEDHLPETTRMVSLRLGVVLARDAKAFKQLKLPMSLGLGAVLGSGDQYFPWIHIDDVISAIEFAINNKNLCGAINLVAPEALSQKQFSQKFAKALNRPLFISVPAFVLRAALGELSDLFLLGQRAIPEKLVNHNFVFRYSSLNKALDNLVCLK
ncbi:MAG: TIGR01777 family oxidoreductase [Emcibacteraceae bacterium]|nr:TIGR01777 family oxidoreductase [Emcibacteraceae bacterium]